jgi:hypothetical protein
MNNEELNAAWSELTKQPVKAWAEDQVKLDLSFITDLELQVKIATSFSGSVSEQFYKLPSSQQDAYLFYFMMATIPNKLLMQAVLSQLKK